MLKISPQEDHIHSRRFGNRGEGNVTVEWDILGDIVVVNKAQCLKIRKL
jgi:tRNA G37 N-methylase Trm5